MQYKVAPALKPGDTIGLVAPSSPLQAGRIECGTHFLEQRGFKVKLGSHIENAQRFLAGKDEDRAQDIMDFFKDPEINAIIATAGGYGSMRLLPLLDFDFIRKYPKILVGFSDTTALQLGLLKQTGLVSYSGFTLRDTDTETPDALVERSLMACLRGKSYSVDEGDAMRAGSAEGRLVGGTLSLITSLLGTPYQPEFKGCILFFEQVWVEPFQIDAMLMQMEMAGIFKDVVGIIIGEFEECSALNPERDGTVEDVLNEWALRFKVPCLKNFPYGHGPRRSLLPIGGHVMLDVDNKKLYIEPQ